MRIVRIAGEIFIVALLYFLTAQLGFLMALPPGNVTALWPPSGLALAAVLLWGWEAGFGVLIGSFFVNYETLSGPNAWGVSLAIAIGSTLQAWLGGYVLQRFVRPVPPDSSLSVLKAVSLTALTTLLAMFIGVTSLCLGNYSPWQNFFTLGWTWWLGDFVGIMIFTPSIITLSLKLRKVIVKEPFLWMLTGIMIGLTLFSFFSVQYSDKSDLERQLISDSYEIRHSIKNNLDKEVQSLYAIRSIVEVSPDLSRQDFLHFTKPFFDQPNITVNALSWVSYVEAGQLPEFTRTMESDFPQFTPYEKDANGNNIPLGERPSYFIVSYIEPFETNQAALGFDIASNASRVEAIEMALSTGLPTATGPIQLVQENEDRADILILVPVYATGSSTSTEEDRRAHVIGLANGVIKIQDLVNRSIKTTHGHDVSIYLFDINTETSPQLLASLSSTDEPTNNDNIEVTIEDLETGLYHSAQFEQFGRQWLLITRPGVNYKANFFSWASWVILAAGLILVGTFLYVNHTRLLTETILAQSEADYRELSEKSLNGLLRVNSSGVISYANTAAAHILGYEHVEDLQRQNFLAFFREQKEIHQLFEKNSKKGQIQNMEVAFRSSKGGFRNLLLSASWSKNVFNINLVDLTELIRAQQDIKLLSSVAAQMGDTVVITDKDGIIQYVNPAFETLTGYSLAELAGQTPRVLRSGKHDIEFYDRLWSTILKGEIFTAEFINKKKNGDLYFEIKTISTIRNAHGIATHFVATGRDISERRRAETLQETVYRISQASQNTQSLDDLYKHIHLEISQVMYAENFYIALYSEDNQKLHFEYFIDQQDLWTDEAFDPKQGLTGYVLRTGKSLLCDQAKDSELAALEGYELVGAPSKIWLGVPLIVKHKVIGVMAVQHYTDEHAYTEREQRMLEFVSTQIASAIENKRTQDKIKQSEKLNSALIANAPDGIALLTPTGRYTFVSPSVLRIFGYTADEAKGKRAFSSLHADDRASIRQKFGDLVKDPNKVFTAEYRYLNKDGVYRWVEGTFSNLKPETDMDLIVSNFRDITDRKNFLELLQQSQSNLEAAQATAHLGSWELNPATGTGFWSKEMFHLFGLDPAQGAPTLSQFMELVEANDRDRLINAQQTAIDSGKSVVIEYCIKQEKVRRCFQATISANKDSNGNLIKMSGTVLDITELKMTQQQLEVLNHELEKRVEERTVQVRQSEETYRALFENSNDGIFLMRSNGEEIRANQQALKMVGYTLEEYLSMGSEKQNPFTQAPEERKDADQKLEAVLRGEFVPLYERTFRAKDGHLVHVEINLSPVRDTQGNIIFVQSVVRDITERKKAEAALRESRDELKAANIALEKAARLKDEFLASMSHELRTPLTGVLGLAESLELRTYGDLNEKQMKVLHNITTSGQHLLELINDILDLSKIEAGKFEMEIQPCDVIRSCNSSMQLIKGIAGRKSQKVSFSIEPESIIIQADERRLKQMLVNLLSNAVKFTPDEGELGLEVKGDRTANVVRFKIWDKGIGIKQEDKEKLFQPFMQLDSRLAREYSGTGLGLSLVKRMTDILNGQIEVESTPGTGSTFTLTLPWDPNGSVIQNKPIKIDASQLRSPLVIDDSELDSGHAAQYLKEIGVQNPVIYPVLTGAFERVLSLQPSMVLLDLYLPDGFGLSLLKQLQNDPRTNHIPIIITSVDERRSDAIKLGAKGYLVKPFSKEDVQGEINKAMNALSPIQSIMIVGNKAIAPLVVMVDDNEVNLNMVSEFLEAKGFQMLTYKDGEKFLQSAPQTNPDVILMDIQMPGMDGLEVIHRVRAHTDRAFSSTPIIALTALAMNGDKEKCLKAGADEYLSKPVKLKQLTSVIEELIRNPKVLD